MPWDGSLTSGKLVKYLEIIAEVHKNHDYKNLGGCLVLRGNFKEKKSYLLFLKHRSYLVVKLKTLQSLPLPLEDRSDSSEPQFPKQ